MRIGLLRHFPVEQALPSGWRTSAELTEWRRRYEQSATSVGVFDLGGIAWQACLASDLPRAHTTARAVFEGPIEVTEVLREVEFAEFRTGRLRLPVKAWEWLLRASWLTGHRSQRVHRDDLRRRVVSAAERLAVVDRDTLVVSHAAMIMYLALELRRRGFSGPKLRQVKHATAYVFERPAANGRVM